MNSCSFTEPEKHISSAHVHFFHLETKPSSGLDQWRCSLGARPLAMLAPWARSTLTALLARSQLELWSLAMLARWARSTTMHGARSLAMLQPGLDQWIAGRHRPSLADQQFCRSHHRAKMRAPVPLLSDEGTHVFIPQTAQPNKLNVHSCVTSARSLR